MQGTIVAVDVAPGDAVQAAPAAARDRVDEDGARHRGRATRASSTGSRVEVGATVTRATCWSPSIDGEAVAGAADAVDDRRSTSTTSGPTSPRCVERHALGLDAARPDAVERRRRTGQRTTRENVDDLVDPGSFVEYGPLVIAAQRRRRELDDLIRAHAGRRAGRRHRHASTATCSATTLACVVMSYDYTVLAGTQGLQNHRKKDRLFELAERLRLPVVFFTEGGGGRPGDTDGTGVVGPRLHGVHAASAG